MSMPMIDSPEASPEWKNKQVTKKAGIIKAMLQVVGFELDPWYIIGWSTSVKGKFSDFKLETYKYS